ncbi:efflux transporter outer membrane subunit [Undibacterium sp. Ren11W]|uniref:efflux transporter outer membrane subunit n=1 Tax=Undibacterium sp. Ren11W TaxID=3413045 RepID=UPI003BF03046
MALRKSNGIRPRTFAAICLSGLLLGCRSLPDNPERSMLDKAPAEWQSTLPVAENATTLNTWWASWNDPSLSALLNLAQEHSPTMAQASARIAQARASASAAGARLWPNIDLNASYIRGHYPLLPQNLDQTVLTTGLDARWELDLFGANAATHDSLLARLSAREYEWHDARISLAAEVANTYLALRSCEAQAQDAYAILASQTISQRMYQEKLTVGFISANDLAQQNAILAASTVQEQQQQSECAILLKSLVVLVDIAEPELRAKLAMGYATLPQSGNFIVASLPIEVLLKRPDMRAAMQNLMASAAEIDAAEARRYPSISLLGSINLYGVQISGQTANLKGWSFGPSLSLPLFDAGARKADVLQAQARHAESQAGFRRQTLMAVQETEVAMLRLDLANRQLQQHQQILEAKNLALQGAEAGWKFGSVSLLEREESRRQQLAALSTQWQLQRARGSAWIALYKAVGGDWQAPASHDSDNKK